MANKSAQATLQSAPDARRSAAQAAWRRRASRISRVCTINPIVTEGGLPAGWPTGKAGHARDTSRRPEDPSGAENKPTGNPMRCDRIPPNLWRPAKARMLLEAESVIWGKYGR
jgi:hypothetical protein